jgi:hypothetical protein
MSHVVHASTQDSLSGRLKQLGRSVSLFHVALAVVAACLFLHGLYYHYGHFQDVAYVRVEILPGIESLEGEPAVVRALQASFLLPPHRGAGNTPDYQLTHPVLKLLGPPASLVHQRGGHCGRRSRLLIAILKQMDIEAHKVHLLNGRFRDFNHSQAYVHAVVEARINGRWIVLDPLYNIVFRNESGGLARLAEIQRDSAIFAAGVRSADERYANYHTELYTYDNYRKFIWSSFPGGETVYGAYERLVGTQRARDTVGPSLLEEPLRALAISSYGAAGILLLILAYSVNRRWRGPR